MARYSAERKEAILKKLSPPSNMTVAELSRNEGISEATLYNWRNQSRKEGKPVPGPNKTTEQWSAQAKFAVVLETATLSEAEFSLYCRAKGLYPEQVMQWKQDCINGGLSEPERRGQSKSQSKADKKRIKTLEKELHRKEKALAEAAALLILRKKLDAFYEEASEDD